MTFSLLVALSPWTMKDSLAAPKFHSEPDPSEGGFLQGPIGPLANSRHTAPGKQRTGRGHHLASCFQTLSEDVEPGMTTLRQLEPNKSRSPATWTEFCSSVRVSCQNLFPSCEDFRSAFETKGLKRFFLTWASASVIWHEHQPSVECGPQHLPLMVWQDNQIWDSQIVGH